MVPPQAIAAIRLLIFTGCRCSEILNLTWGEVDIDGHKLALRDSKTGAKDVHLAPPAIEVLQGLPRLADNPHVIPGRRPGAATTDLKGAWDRIRAYDLNTRLGARIEALCRELLPGGEPDGATWRCKALKGGVGDRVRVKLAGDRPGAWHDASTNQAGRPIELVKAARGLRSRSAAVAWAKDWLGDSESGGLVDVRLHDLRHSFASVGAGAGLSLPIIGALLGHSQPATTARYAHLASDPLQEAVNLVGRRLADALGGKGRDGGEVLKLSNKAKR